MPVAICASRAATSARKPSRSVTRPAACSFSASCLVASALSVATRSRTTRSSVMRSVMMRRPSLLGGDRDRRRRGLRRRRLGFRAGRAPCCRAAGRRPGPRPPPRPVARPGCRWCAGSRTACSRRRRRCSAGTSGGPPAHQDPSAVISRAPCPPRLTSSSLVPRARSSAGGVDDVADGDQLAGRPISCELFQVGLDHRRAGVDGGGQRRPRRCRWPPGHPTATAALVTWA